MGELAPEISAFDFKDLLPSIGTGSRYQLMQKNPVHVRADLAYGLEGFGLYVGFGEAF